MAVCLGPDPSGRPIVSSPPWSEGVDDIKPVLGHGPGGLPWHSADNSPPTWADPARAELSGQIGSGIPGWEPPGGSSGAGRADVRRTHAYGTAWTVTPGSVGCSLPAAVMDHGGCGSSRGPGSPRWARIR